MKIGRVWFGLVWLYVAGAKELSTSSHPEAITPVPYNGNNAYQLPDPVLMLVNQLVDRVSSNTG